MRVLVMSHTWVPETGAGAQTTAHDLLRAVVDAGHTVDVLLSQNRITSQIRVQDGITIYPHIDTGDPFRWFGNPENSPQVVVSHLEGSLRAAVLSKIHHIPHVHVLHNDMPFTKFAVMEGPSNLVVYNTHWMKESFESWLYAHDAVPPRNVVVHPPVYPIRYTTTPGNMITQVNLFTGTKNPSVFYEMARRFPDRPFLGVLGAYGDQLIMDLPNVELVGPFEPDEMVDQVYRRTKVLLMPSDYESYGRTAVEACCSGIPVLASTASGLVEALGPDGTCIEYHDYDRWEAELRRVLSPRGWSSASHRALAVAAGLTTEADVARWLAELESVALRPTGPHEIMMRSA